MAPKEPTIRILPDGEPVKTLPGISLFEALMHQGIFLRSDCGGKGKCGKCRVLKKTENGDFIEVNACTDTVETDVSVKIPGTSLNFSHTPSQTMDKATLIFPHTFAETFRENTGSEIPDYGAAVDLGTTTIAIYLCEISKKEVVSSIAVKNPQCVHGADVISRISAIGKKADGLHRLQQLVVKSIEWGLKTVSKALKDDPVSITRMVVVGNPTMIHILAGIDPKPIGTAPYQPVFYTEKKFRSDQLGFEGEPFTVQTLPQASGYIGGDILAASLSAGLGSQPDHAPYRPRDQWRTASEK